MRRVLVLTCIALALPVAAWAGGIQLTNQFGTITASTAGIVAAQSQLKTYNAITAPVGHSLGSVSFSTGALSSGSFLNGGTFSAVGSSFNVVGVGSFGQPKGTIFSGSFLGPISWTLDSVSGKTRLYTLSGKIVGMFLNGRTVTGTTVQNIQILGNGVGRLLSGSANIAVPEPGTLGLLGTGLLGIAGMFRRKLMGR